MNRLTARSVKDLFLLLAVLLLALSSAATLAEDLYPVESYTGVYDKQAHSIKLNFDTDGLVLRYFIGDKEY